MQHKPNQFLAPNRHLFSGSQLLENCAQQKPSKEIGWELRRTVPSHVLAARVMAENKEMLRETRESFRHTPAPLGLLCKKVKGNKVQIIGHGIDENTPRVVQNFAAAKDYAREIGRHFVVMGAIHAKV